MKSVVHEEFVKAVKEAILNKDSAIMKFEKDQVVSILSDILCLGREAIYRRLRGDVKFSLDEAAMISLKLDVSIDSLIGIDTKDRSMIELNLVDASDNYVVKYIEKLQRYTSLVNSLSHRYSEISIRSSFNKLPCIFYLKYENLSKFRLFKWAYQMRLVQGVSIKDVNLPDSVFNAQVAFVNEVRKVKNTDVILSPNVFSSFINDIRYFFNLNLIDEKGIELIKGELLSLLDEVESMAVSGLYHTNNNIGIYLSDLALDDSYMLFRYDKYVYAHFDLYDIGGVDTSSRKIGESHYRWIESLKRYSKLITKSNEIERFRFFNEQRLMINELG